MDAFILLGALLFVLSYSGVCVQCLCSQRISPCSGWLLLRLLLICARFFLHWSALAPPECVCLWPVVSRELFFFCSDLSRTWSCEKVPSCPCSTRDSPGTGRTRSSGESRGREHESFVRVKSATTAPPALPRGFVVDLLACFDFCVLCLINLAVLRQRRSQQRAFACLLVTVACSCLLKKHASFLF